MSVVEELKKVDGKDREAVEASIGEFLYNEIKERKPNVVVEIGTGNGYSGTWIAQALKENEGGIFTTIDNVNRNIEWLSRFDETPRINTVCGEYADFVRSIPEPIDMLFLDGDHQINNIVKDIELAYPYLSEGAMVYVHDTLYIEIMGKCLSDYFNGIDSELLNSTGVKSSKLDWEYRNLEVGSGLGIAKLKTKGEKKND